jgi:hypothetical protein
MRGRVEPSVRLQRHGLIAEAGMYFSLLRRAFLQRYANARGAPAPGRANRAA